MDFSESQIREGTKSPAEIRELIKAALVKNKILGYLNNNILYMQSFGKSNSLSSIFAVIGIGIILSGGRAKELDFNQGLIILISGIGCFIISAILAKLVKYYLVYDIEREVFYTITKVFNKTISETKEIDKNDFIELGVNVIDKDGDNVNSNAVFFTGDKMDNPALKSAFVGLLSNGKIVNISDPVGLRKPHEAIVERCKLFSECFGLNSVICEKNESLKAIKDNNNMFKLVKYSKDKEWAKIKSVGLVSGGLAFLAVILGAIVLFAIIYFLG